MTSAQPANAGSTQTRTPGEGTEAQSALIEALALEKGNAGQSQSALAACPICGEPRGSETPCPHCGMD